jgi:hypothetical protein
LQTQETATIPNNLGKVTVSFVREKRKTLWSFSLEELSKHWKRWFGRSRIGTNPDKHMIFKQETRKGF